MSGVGDGAEEEVHRADEPLEEVGELDALGRGEGAEGMGHELRPPFGDLGVSSGSGRRDGDADDTAVVVARVPGGEAGVDEALGRRGHHHLPGGRSGFGVCDPCTVASEQQVLHAHVGKTDARRPEATRVDAEAHRQLVTTWSDLDRRKPLRLRLLRLHPLLLLRDKQLGLRRLDLLVVLKQRIRDSRFGDTDRNDFNAWCPFIATILECLGQLFIQGIEFIDENLLQSML